MSAWLTEGSTNLRGSGEAVCEPSADEPTAAAAADGGDNHGAIRHPQSTTKLEAVEQFQAAAETRRTHSSPSAAAVRVVDSPTRFGDWMEVSWKVLRHQVEAADPCHVVSIAVGAVALVTCPPGRMLLQWTLRHICAWIGTVMGTAIGVGLGLGLALHVYEQLDVWEQQQQQQQDEQQDVLLDSGPMMKLRLQRSRTASSSNLMMGAGLSSSRNNMIWMARSNSRFAIGPSSSVEDAAVAILEDEQTYHSLMLSAGYHSPRFVLGHELPVQQLRGQVLRADQVPTVNYPLTASPDVSQWKAVVSMRDLWPTLPPAVQESLGKAIEYILRDFVAMWYYKADPGCIYNDPAEEKRMDEAKRGEPKQSATTTIPSKQFHHPRVMMYSVAVHRPLPFMDALYESCSVVFGNLATRVEHVNVLELILLKWTRILAHTFKWYRALRKNVKTKQLAHNAHVGGGPATSGHGGVEESSSSSRVKSQLSRRGLRMGGEGHPAHEEGGGSGDDGKSQRAIYVPVSEIAMTKEFLFAGKLHRAVTFGLDVPSFLFADANGRDCGKPKRSADGKVVVVGGEDEEHDNKSRPNFTEDDVLAARLFETNVLSECELDYNRVVGHRMVRALVSRGDFGSNIVSTLLTEIMGGCVLTPIMSIFSPAYLNSWIISGLSKSEAKEDGVGVDTDDATSGAVDLGLSACEGVPAGETVEVVLENDNNPLIRQEQCNDSQIGTNAMAEECSSKARPGGTLQVVDSPLKIAEAVRLNTDLPMDNQSALDTGDLLSLSGDSITTKLAMAIIDLQQYIDFEECREAGDRNEGDNVDWDGEGCRDTVVRLVLVIEAALTHGRCNYTQKGLGDDVNGVTADDDKEADDCEHPIEVTLPQYESATLTQILMELTNDIDAFEERVASENALLQHKITDQFESMIPEDYQPTAADQSTLRILIATWLQKGQIYRTVTLLVQAQTTILAPFYHRIAFLRSKENANGFVRQLRSLEGVHIMVDTMSVQASPRLADIIIADLSSPVMRSAQSPGMSTSHPHDELQHGAASSPSLILSNQFASSSSIPRYLDFNRNESFAASLRSERERRMQSWERLVNEDNEEGLPIIHRTRGVSDEDIALHKELHHIARIFYGQTNMLALRDAARRTIVEVVEGGSEVAESPVSNGGIQVSLLTVETACPRRRIEVPDDDSSFLLRAQPRPLNAVGVHRDQRNHDQSFKCFAATYDEPALNNGSEHYTGGRYIRRCLIRYYPIDRTASVALQNDARKLDQRKSKSSVPDTITVGQSSRPAPLLSSEFLKERHLCQRWVPKGTTRSQSLLASSVMEATDFTSTPRTGKAIDFVYRMNFFERPMLDLGGKHFTVHDSTSLGAHRADASTLEISDASLSFALLTLGAGDDERAGNVSGTQRQGIEMGKDGYPVVWMKFSRNDAHVEVKPYRISFVRAALMVTAARNEAQVRCLVYCVKAGSAKKATKALTDAYLKPSVKLVEYASSPSRGKQSLLLRDLKLGVNHIDRGQLRRNALLSPRYPTELLELSASVEDAVQAPDVKGVIDLFGVSSSVYKIKCSATVILVASDDELNNESGYKLDDGSFAETYKEEWVVYRSLKEFQALHKHLKLQVSAAESSGTAGSRLVGAATAAFAATTASLARNRQRKVLLPSLSQASKAGALGVTKKLILKRKEIIDGYLGYLLSPGHLLGRCAELLLFLGASFPLAPNVRVGETIHSSTDPFRRTEMTRSVLQLRALVTPDAPLSFPSVPRQSHDSRMGSTSSAVSIDSQEDDMLEDDDEGDPYRKSGRKVNMIPAVKNKIDKVTLPQVRNRIFELLRYQFGFENASFARNRMLAALKTASFAVTSAAEFRKTLYKLHTEHVNSEAIAGWINFLSDTLWPGGVFFESKPPLSLEELQEQANKAKELLHGSFPDQVRTILGQDLTRDGMDIFHEMLQNRMVVKSMAYMLFDLMWVEVFPEIGDVLPCGAALDIDT